MGIKKLHADVLMVLKDGHSLSLEDHFIHMLNTPAINNNNVQLILTRLIYMCFIFYKEKKIGRFEVLE